MPLPPEVFRHTLKDKLADRLVGIQNETDFFRSAVVLPLVPQGDDLALLFEVRSNQLSWQPGEICFPGGRIEPSDRGPQQAAARETCEELGLDSGALEILGPLDFQVSPIGVIIYPFAGFIAEPDKIKPNPGEVAELFTVPLKYFLTTEPLTATMEVATRPLADFPLELMPPGYPQNWRRRATYPVLFYKYDKYVIWGLSARLLHNFVQVCREAGIANR